MKSDEKTLAVLSSTRIKRHKKRFRRDDMELTILAMPTFVWHILFSYLPMFGVIIAFKDFPFQSGHGFLYNLFASPWSGAKNFEFLFKSNDAWLIIRNTLGYNTLFIILGVVIPVTLAILLNQLRSRRTAKIAQTAMLMPYFMSWVVVTYFVGAFLNYDYGLINQVLRLLGRKVLTGIKKPMFGRGF